MNYVSALDRAFHHSVNGQKSVRARLMGRSLPNFSPKLEPIHRTTLDHARKFVRKFSYRPIVRLTPIPSDLCI